MRPGAVSPPVPGTRRGGVAGHGCAPPRYGRALRRRRAAPIRRGTGREAVPLAGVGPRRTPRRSHDRGSARSGRETGAAATSTRAEHGATPLGAHPHAKTVRLLALAVVGLERALHPGLLEAVPD